MPFSTHSSRSDWALNGYFKWVQKTILILFLTILYTSRLQRVFKGYILETWALMHVTKWTWSLSDFGPSLKLPTTLSFWPFLLHLHILKHMKYHPKPITQEPVAACKTFALRVWLTGHVQHNDLCVTEDASPESSMQLYRQALTIQILSDRC